MANKQIKIADIVRRAQSGEDITPYQIATMINAIFEVQQIKKVDGSLLQIRPQMMYNYDSNGLICKGKRATRAYSLAEVLAFVQKYTTKKGATWSLDFFNPQTQTDNAECDGQLALI